MPASLVGPIRIPHAAPFRLIDRVVSVDLAAGGLVAERLLTCNDALWPGESQPPRHFFSEASPAAAALVFPPTLLIEALCQAAACLNAEALAGPGAPAAQQHHGYLVAITDMKFPAFAYVGETVTLKVEQKERRGQVIAFAVSATAAPPTAGASGQAPGQIEPHEAKPGQTKPRQIQPREIACGRLLFAVTLT